MATYFMFGRYSTESIGKISSKRTQDANALIEKNGGKVHSGYILLGKDDLVLIVDFPDVNKVIKASVELSKLLGIRFITAPAVTVEEFDRLMG